MWRFLIPDFVQGCPVVLSDDTGCGKAGTACLTVQKHRLPAVVNATGHCLHKSPPAQVARP